MILCISSGRSHQFSLGIILGKYKNLGDKKVTKKLLFQDINEIMLYTYIDKKT